MSDTYGPRSGTSSRSAALQQSLESRLQAAMGANGSPEYALTWRRWDMPSGPPICALRASARRTSVKDCSGWPTPNTPSGGRSVSIEKMDATGRTVDGKKHTASLEHAVKFAGWATPTTRDWRDGRASQAAMERNARPLNEQATMLAGRTADGSSALTESTAGYRLNPLFSLWLMGFPVEWASYAPTATPSSRK